MAPLDAFPRARDVARRALALDSTIPSAYLALAWATAALDRDCQGAVRLIDRAVALDSTIPEGWAIRGTILFCAHRGAEALAAVRRAWELDSLSGLTGTYLIAMTLVLEPQRVPETFALVRRRLPPEGAGYWGASVAQRRGDCTTAEQLGRPLAATNSFEPYVLALVCLGRRAEADSVVRAAIADTSKRYVNPVVVAVGLLALGDRDGAMRWLERGADERTWWMTFIHVREDLAALRDDPRFQALERRLGLQP
jgi:hypothetical protein